eukprot:644295-Pleurochrysis_carterae.AAC.3
MAKMADLNFLNTRRMNALQHEQTAAQQRRRPRKTDTRRIARSAKGATIGQQRTVSTADLGVEDHDLAGVVSDGVGPPVVAAAGPLVIGCCFASVALVVNVGGCEDSVSADCEGERSEESGGIGGRASSSCRSYTGRRAGA